MQSQEQFQFQNPKAMNPQAMNTPYDQNSNMVVGSQPQLDLYA